MYPVSTTVITAAQSSALADVVHLRTALGVEATDAGATAELTRALGVASAAISNYCGRDFALQTVRASYARVEVIALVHLPVASIASITNDSGDALTYRATDAGVVYLEATPPSPVHVTYTGGYSLPTDATPTLPADLEQCALDLARSIYLERHRAQDVRREQLDGISAIDYAEARGLPLGVLDRLAPYRLIRL